MLITLLFTILALAESAVLDPALFLSPSPPLTQTSDSLTPEELWLQPLQARMERIAREAAEKLETTTEEPAAESGRMFWPRYSAPQPTLGINIPLTFTLSGSYGKRLLASSGAVGDTYTSITGFGSSLLGKTATAGVYGNYGRSALAGSSYGSFGSYGAPSVRVYGGESAASWSGWGNGKWGHYGKG